MMTGQSRSQAKRNREESLPETGHAQYRRAHVPRGPRSLKAGSVLIASSSTVLSLPFLYHEATAVISSLDFLLIGVLFFGARVALLKFGLWEEGSLWSLLTSTRR